MPLANFKIVGVCRFSYLGLGDWRDFHSQRNGRTNEEIVAERRPMLFDTKRLAQRFATFENVTLPSFAAQSDLDFSLVALTSDELPAWAMARLKQLAVRYPFLLVRPFGIATSREAVTGVYRAEGWDMARLLQFRIDDDDALGRHYIRKLRHWGERMLERDLNTPFAITFPKTLVVAELGDRMYFGRRFYSHTATGHAMHHHDRCIIDWAHNKVGDQLISLSDPAPWVLSTHLAGINDTGALNNNKLGQMGVTELDSTWLSRVLDDQFPWATADSAAWRKIAAGIEDAPITSVA